MSTLISAPIGFDIRPNVESNVRSDIGPVDLNRCDIGPNVGPNIGPNVGPDVGLDGSNIRVD